MKYTITPYAYRKIRETIKQSQRVIKAFEKIDDEFGVVSRERVVIKLTIVK